MGSNTPLRSRRILDPVPGMKDGTVALIMVNVELEVVAIILTKAVI